MDKRASFLLKNTYLKCYYRINKYDTLNYFSRSVYMKHHIVTLIVFLCLNSVFSIWADDDEFVDYSFPKEEYEHYMKLIKEIDPKAYQRLRTCENALGAPCIDEAVDIDPIIEYGSEETKGYPIMVLKSMKDDPDEQYQKNMLKIYLDWYMTVENMTPITQKERDIVLDLIKTVAPTLHEMMVKMDPTGEQHIERYKGNGFASLASLDDGFPIILVGQDSLNEPRNLLEASIAHELGHYVSRHFFEYPEPTHAFLLTDETSTAKGLPAKETFNLARRRIEEFEADSSEIMDFNIDIDTAIKQAKILQAKAEELQLKEPGKKTFKSTHPLWSNRIKHFESLRKEVELKKAQGKERKTVFDWKKLAQDYKNAFNK